MEVCPGCLYELALAGLSPPERDFGEYRIEATLGRGGTGIVYRARHLGLNRLVALKVLNHHRGQSLKRFQREAEASAALDHPHIVPIFEIGENNGQSFLAIQLIEGCSLAQTLSGKAIDPRRAAQILLKISRAIDYAHARGVLHRDLKPDNILLDAADEPHLTDFGSALIANQGDRLTLEGEVFGSLPYMSPEQISGDRRDVSVRSDVYGLGAVLYECLTGQAPFKFQDRLNSLQAIAAEEPKRPCELNRGIPTVLETICLKCLAKEPQRRYASAQSLADDLQAFLENRPISARPAGALERVRLWVRRRPALAGLWVASCLALLGIIVGAILWQRGRSIQAASEARASLQSAFTATRAPRREGWSNRAWRELHRAAALRSDPYFRDYVASALDGLDVRLETNRAASAFPDGSPIGLFFEQSTNGLATVATGSLIAIDPRSSSQIVRQNDGQFVVWGSQQQRILGQLEMPPEINSFSQAITAISADRICLAALLEPAVTVLAAWDWPSGRLKGVSRLASFPSVLTLSAASAHVAYGDESGQVSVDDLDRGTNVCRFRPTKAPIRSIAFGTHPRHPHSQELVAVGDNGGSIVVWDPAAGQALSYCRGSAYTVAALAFSPDRMFLAGGGRLWDVATGRAVLEVVLSNQALAFDPLGRWLADSGPEGRSEVWSIENGRGIRNLYGLGSSVTHLTFSRDGTLLAALCMGWEVAVWDLINDRLLCVLDVAKGVSADNCGLAISPDLQLLAFAAGTEAQLWKIHSAELFRRWSLPMGIADSLTFSGSNTLSLVRRERTERGPVCRLRNLLSSHPEQPIAELTDFPRYVYAIEASADGRLFAIAGLGESNNVAVIDAVSGTVVWRGVANARMSPAFFSSQGSTLAWQKSRDEWWRTDLSSRTESFRFVVRPDALGPDGLLWASKFPPVTVNPGVTVFRNNQLLVTLGLHNPMDFFPEFDPTGRLLAWGNQDGTVALCDLAEIQKRLLEHDITIDVTPL